jgi:hypothetical protein
MHFLGGQAGWLDRKDSYSVPHTLFARLFALNPRVPSSQFLRSYPARKRGQPFPATPAAAAEVSECMGRSVKAPACHPPSFVCKRNNPQRALAFSSMVEHHNPSAIHSPLQGFYLLTNVT